MPKQLFNLIYILIALTLPIEFVRAELCSEFEFKSKTKKTTELWNSQTPLEISIEAPFTLIREKGEGGNFYGEDWDAPEAGKTEMGLLTVTAKNGDLVKVPIVIRARGMSSLQTGEVEFPKLKVKFEHGKENREKLESTELAGIKGFKLNTHVTNTEDINNPDLARTEMGRLRSENSPLREYLAYQIAEGMGLVTPHLRLAQVHYTETADKSQYSKKALMIESGKSITERLNATSLDVSDVQNYKVIPIDPVEGALFHLFHKIIGNDDVGLHIYETIKMPTEKNRPLFNTELYQFADGSLHPLIFDLDLATFVSGYELLSANLYANASFGLNASGKSITAHKLFHLRMRIPHTHILAAVDRVKALRGKLYALMDNAKLKKQIDETGYQNANAHLNNFYEVVDWVMSTKVLGTKEIHFYHDSKAETSGLLIDKVTEEMGVLRVGTPLKILGEENNMYKVAIIDTSWDVSYDSSIAPNVPATVGYVSKNINLIDYLPIEDVGLLDSRDMMF
jgi:hypothetical protein